MIVATAAVRRRRTVLGFPGLVRAPLAACLALVCLLGAAGCVAPSSGGTAGPAAPPPRARPPFGLAMCADDAPAPAPPPAADSCDAPPVSAQRGPM